MDPKAKRSIWNTPISEITGRFKSEGSGDDSSPPDLGFLVKPILGGIGIFLIIVFGYLLVKNISEAIITSTANMNNTTANAVTSNPFITVFSTTNSTTLVVLLMAPIWLYILWRPIRRMLRGL